MRRISQMVHLLDHPYGVSVVLLLFCSNSLSTELSGLEIMQQSYTLHQRYPYVYEEQTMVLVDQQGLRNTRKLRFYSRLEEDGGEVNLLLFDAPAEIHGVAILTQGYQRKIGQSELYIPAFGPQLISVNLTNQVEQPVGMRLLGSDFRLRDLLPEPLEDHTYTRMDDERIDGVVYWVVESDPVEAVVNREKRRYYIRQDNYYISRTDIFNHHNQLIKQKSEHDLRPLGNGLWRANMILMIDTVLHHQTLIKIDRRVFSKDYVPSRVFTSSWLVENQGVPNNSEEKPLSNPVEGEQ